ncbi:hypothetical protein GF342_05600 [Candidatus Woesearchaeota archaeon]|nr:hypothetical protein [Candidatus Woesearchaeota archaeon]
MTDAPEVEAQVKEAVATGSTSDLIALRLQQQGITSESPLTADELEDRINKIYRSSKTADEHELLTTLQQGLRNGLGHISEYEWHDGQGNPVERHHPDAHFRGSHPGSAFYFLMDGDTEHLEVLWRLFPQAKPLVTQQLQDAILQSASPQQLRDTVFAGIDNMYEHVAQQVLARGTYDSTLVHAAGALDRADMLNAKPKKHRLQRLQEAYGPLAFQLMFDQGHPDGFVIAGQLAIPSDDTQAAFKKRFDAELRSGNVSKNVLRSGVVLGTLPKVCNELLRGERSYKKCWHGAVDQLLKSDDVQDWLLARGVARSLDKWGPEHLGHEKVPGLRAAEAKLITDSTSALQTRSVHDPALYGRAMIFGLDPDPWEYDEYSPVNDTLHRLGPYDGSKEKAMKVINGMCRSDHRLHTIRGVRLAKKLGLEDETQQAYTAHLDELFDKQMLPDYIIPWSACYTDTSNVVTRFLDRTLEEKRISEGMIEFGRRVDEELLKQNKEYIESANVSGAQVSVPPYFSYTERLILPSYRRIAEEHIANPSVQRIDLDESLDFARKYGVSSGYLEQQLAETLSNNMLNTNLIELARIDDKLDIARATYGSIVRDLLDAEDESARTAGQHIAKMLEMPMDKPEYQPQ